MLTLPRVYYDVVIQLCCVYYCDGNVVVHIGVIVIVDVLFVMIIVIVIVICSVLGVVCKCDVFVAVDMIDVECVDSDDAVMLWLMSFVMLLLMLSRLLL